MPHTVDYAVVPSARLAPLSEARVAHHFRRLLDDGARLLPAGSAKRRPGRLLTLGYVPRFTLSLFEKTFFLTAPRQNDDIRFLVAYVMDRAPDGTSGRRTEHGAEAIGREWARGLRIYPRIFYKDISLTWRSASHWIRTDHENWIGKGDINVIVWEGREFDESDEATTDLPLEMQTALENVCRARQRIPYDDDAVGLVLRRAPAKRIAPYEDFTAPRRRAESNPRNLVNEGERIARFTRENDPSSLRFVKGYAPDFRNGVVEVARGSSRIYGGALRRYRIVSENRRVQYFFMAGPRQVWIASCQATSTELSTFGLRTVDANVPDELMMPAYEYHFVDTTVDPPELYSQIPPGFAGEVSPVDASRVDTSPWLEEMPVIRDFRRVVLGRRRRGG